MLPGEAESSQGTARQGAAGPPQLRRALSEGGKDSGECRQYSEIRVIK